MVDLSSSLSVNVDQAGYPILSLMIFQSKPRGRNGGTGDHVDGKWSAGAVVRAKSQRLAQVGGVFLAMERWGGKEQETISDLESNSVVT